MIVPELLTLSREIGMGAEERFDFDNNGVITYYGLAQLGTLTSAPGWYLIAYTINANQQTTRIRYSGPNQIWDNRATILP